MDVSITARPDAPAALARLRAVLAEVDRRVVACSGGIDSLVLAVVAHRARPSSTTVAHTVTPAVPGDATVRVVAYARREAWNLEIVRSGEFDDESYLANPVDRCYHCKDHLYRALDDLAVGTDRRATVLSGANLDDLGEYRPGLVAAEDHEVRHPYIEAGVGKGEIRSIARHLGLPDAGLPASPCLASRLYTGTRVTAGRLRAIEAGESLVRERTGIGVVRCRVDDGAVLVEVADDDRSLVDDDILSEVASVMVAVEPSITSVVLDERGYRPGRAFVGAHGPAAS
jgi:uncharacterized protein